MNSCSLPPTCGICICNPSLEAVGVCAATANVGNPVCGNVGTAACGMPQVTVNATKPTIWPWVIGIGAALWLLSRHRRG